MKEENAFSNQLLEDFSLQSYDYHLPEELIAQRAVEGRQNSRLLIYDRKTDRIGHHYFYELPQLLPPQSLLVFNRTQVYPCRLFGKRPTGGKAELFILSLTPNQVGAFPCLLRSKGVKKKGEAWHFDELLATLAIDKSSDEDVFWMHLELKDQKFDSLEAFLNHRGRIPIPPYIRKGEDDEKDRVDYQTVYAKEVGSVAAPTAGLHFTPSLLEQLKECGHDQAFLTLHVGMGTFLPVKSDDIRDHHMHSETYFFDSENAEKIKSARAAGTKIFAIGTTSLRALESRVVRDSGDFDISSSQVYSTDIFLHPGKQIKSIDGLITNFHLPKSSLIMLVSALIGRKKTLEIYNEAVKQKYRFFSYGDSMLIL